MNTDSSTRLHVFQSLWLQGAALALPIALGYTPVAFAFGVLANSAGISTSNVVLMSLLVYAGSSQLIVVGLFAAGAPALSIVLTTLVVNLRHLLMSASLSPYLHTWRLLELAGFAYQLTDETFALHSTRFHKQTPQKPVVFTLNMIAHAIWVFGSWLGCTAGKLIPDVSLYGLDFALPAMFIALLLLQFKDHLHIGVAALAGLFSLGLIQVGVTRWNVILATLLASTIAVIVKQWTKR